MFVVQSYSSEISNLFIYDKPLPMGSVTERAHKSISLSSFATLRGTAHTKFFTMQREKASTIALVELGDKLANYISPADLPNRKKELTEMFTWFCLQDNDVDERNNAYCCYMDLMAILEIMERIDRAQLKKELSHLEAFSKEQLEQILKN